MLTGRACFAAHRYLAGIPGYYIGKGYSRNMFLSVILKCQIRPFQSDRFFVNRNRRFYRIDIGMVRVSNSFYPYGISLCFFPCGNGIGIIAVLLKTVINGSEFSLSCIYEFLRFTVISKFFRGRHR